MSNDDKQRKLNPEWVNAPMRVWWFCLEPRPAGFPDCILDAADELRHSDSGPCPESGTEPAKQQPT